MKAVITAFILFVGHSFTWGQQANKLYYFQSKDSLIGVKNQNGNIIIPAKHLNFSLVEEDFSAEITDDIIILLPSGRQANKESKTFGLAYNRKGEVLYAPYLFDNGPDYLEEGLIRFVENGKIGFVDRFGKKAIKAQWDWASPFEYGIAKACNNCSFDYSKDPEHPSLDLSKASTFYIDKQGHILTPVARRQSEKDQLMDGTYISYQFKYNKFEDVLRKKLADVELISKAYFANFYSPLTEKEKVLHFEIVERPSNHFPYYVIQGFCYSGEGSYTKADGPDLTFYANKKGEIFFIPYGGSSKEKIPFQQWVANFDAEAKQFLKEHPDAIHRY